MRTIGFPAICAQFRARSIASWKAARLAKATSLAVNHFSPALSPAMMIDLAGSEQTALSTLVGRAIADERHPQSPRIRTMEAVLAKPEPRPPSPPRCRWRQGLMIGSAMSRHPLTELTTESFLKQPVVRRLCKHCRWARPAWPVLPMALLPYLWPEFWRLATCRHPTSVDPPLRDYVSGRPMKPRRLACNTARVTDLRGRCGPQARYWESR
jgi:hypothetical protein